MNLEIRSKTVHPVKEKAAAAVESAPRLGDRPRRPHCVVARAWRRSPSAVLGFTMTALVVLIALISLVWTPFDPTAIPSAPHRFLGPGAVHLLGTDQYGRDVLSRMMAGTQVVLYGGAIAVAIAALIGIPAGLYAAQRGGTPGDAIMRVADLMFAFPALLIAMVLAADFGSSTTTAMIAIGIAYIPIFARVTRSAALQVLSCEYILAAKAAGRTRLAITRKHVVPNIVTTILVQMSLLMSLAVLAEAALSYLGLGTAPPTPSWGHMLHTAQSYIYTDSLLSIWPGLMVAATILGFNLLGDGLREILDPRGRAVRS